MAAKITVIDYIPEWLSVDSIDEYEELNNAVNDCTIEERNDYTCGNWRDLEDTTDLN